MKVSGRQVAAARELLDITQDQLAQAASVDKSTLNRFEKGHQTPHASTLLAITAELERRGIEFTNGDGVGVRLVNKTKPT